MQYSRIKILFFLLIIHFSTFAQQSEANRGKHYLSLRGTFLYPIGIFNDGYTQGLGIHGITHFKWLGKSAEVQLIAGYERFFPEKGNIFGAITMIPIKMGVLQMLTRGAYMYGRVGVVSVKDQRSDYVVRFSTEAGLGYAFKHFSIDICLHGWLRQHHGGFTNYLSAGLICPFKRVE